MFQNEFRHDKNKTKYLVDFGFVNGYKSSNTNKKKSKSYILKLKHNLDLFEFNSSEINFSLESTNNDTYLKVFDTHITKSNVRPSNFDSLQNKFDIYLDHPNYNFDAGIISHEDMQVSNNNDRYQYNLPYYNYSTSINQTKLNGSFFFLLVAIMYSKIQIS